MAGPRHVTWVPLVCILIGLPAPARTAEVATPGDAEPPSTSAAGYRRGPSGIDVVETTRDGERVVATVSLPPPLHDLVVLRSVLYVARGTAGVTAIDVQAPKAPRQLLTFAAGQPVLALSAQEAILLLGLADGTTLRYDVSDPNRPALLGRMELSKGKAPLLTPREDAKYQAARTGVATSPGQGLLIAGGVLIGVGLALGISAAAVGLSNCHGDLCLGRFISAVSVGGIGGLCFVVGVPIIAVGSARYRRWR